jgi:hypothetical protein
MQAINLKGFEINLQEIVEKWCTFLPRYTQNLHGTISFSHVLPMQHRWIGCHRRVFLYPYLWV